MRCFRGTVPGKPSLIWRKADGSCAMIADRCPHRIVPLSMGRHTLMQLRKAEEAAAG